MTSIPTTEMFKDGKRMICNQADSKAFEALGWNEKQDQPADGPKPAKSKSK